MATPTAVCIAKTVIPGAANFKFHKVVGLMQALIYGIGRFQSFARRRLGARFIVSYHCLTYRQHRGSKKVVACA